MIMYTSGTTGRPEGRDAHPWQFLVEQRQRHAHARHARRRRHADRRADFPHRRAQRDDAGDVSEGRARRPAPRASTPAARSPTSPRTGSRPCSACPRCSCSWRNTRLRRDGSVVGSPAHRRRRALPAAGAEDLSRARRVDAAGLWAHRDLADGELPRAGICADQGRLVGADARCSSRSRSSTPSGRDDRDAARAGRDPGARAERDARAIGACPRRRRRRSTRTAGSTPATPASSTRRASSPSATASRT